MEQDVLGRMRLRVESVREILRRLSRHESGVLAGILAALIIIFGAATRGGSLTVRNWSSILQAVSMKGIVTMGQTFVLLTTNLDLSVGGLALLGNMVGASVMTGQTGFPVKGIALTLLFGLGVGLGNGILVTRLRIPSLIVTLASWQMLEGGAWTMTGGWPITDLPKELEVFTCGLVGPIPVATIVFIVVIVVSHFVLGYTTFGRSVYAVGGNRVSAWLSGVDVKNTTLFVFVISGFCAALASIISLSRTMAGTLVTGLGFELDSITAAAIGGVSLAGGRGTIIGAVIGVFIVAVINNGMNRLGIIPAWQLVVRAVIIIGAVAVDYIRRRG